MELVQVNQDSMTKFIESIVLKMKPQLKSDFDRKDINQIINASSREWLNAKESASYLSVSEPTFREWRRKYKIPSRTVENITRWKKSDLDRFMKSKGVEGYL